MVRNIGQEVVIVTLGADRRDPIPSSKLIFRYLKFSNVITYITYVEIIMYLYIHSAAQAAAV